MNPLVSLFIMKYTQRRTTTDARLPCLMGKGRVWNPLLAQYFLVLNTQEEAILIAVAGNKAGASMIRKVNRADGVALLTCSKSRLSKM